MSREIEEWKPIEGYESLYEVSDWGRIKSLSKEIVNNIGVRKHGDIILKNGKSFNGYFSVVLYKDKRRKMYSVHRLVAEAFLEIPEELKKYIGTRKLQVNHKDEDKTNNRLENLEWMSAKDNTNYGTARQRMTEKQLNSPKKSKTVYQYDLEGNLIAIFPSTMECVRNGFKYVRDCCRGKIKTYKGYIWKYAST